MYNKMLVTPDRMIINIMQPKLTTFYSVCVVIFLS